MIALRKAQDWQTFPEDAERLFTITRVSSAISKISQQITQVMTTRVLTNKNLLVLCVMRGGVVFSGMVIPQLTFPLEFDYVDISRYPSGSTQPDLIAAQTHFPTAAKLANRTVLLLDDILDEGVTLHTAKDKLLYLGAAKVYCAVMVTKNRPRTLPEADFSALLVPDRFVFGMGMDYKGLWRNLPAIYALKK